MQPERSILDPDVDSLLIVDNDTALLARLRRAIDARGFAVSTVSTEADAVQFAREFEPRYALVDLRLAPGDGPVVVAALHRMHPACRAVIFTG